MKLSRVNILVQTFSRMQLFVILISAMMLIAFAIYGVILASIEYYAFVAEVAMKDNFCLLGMINPSLAIVVAVSLCAVWLIFSNWHKDALKSAGRT